MAVGDNNKYTISIDTAILFACEKKISASIREEHQLTLQKTNIK